MESRASLTGIQAMKALSKRHLPQDIKRVHLIPLGHIQALGTWPGLLAQHAHKLVDDTQDDGFLLEEAALRKGRVEHLAHGRVLLGVALAAHTLAREPGREDLVKGPLGRCGLAPRGVPVDRFPGVGGGERELVWGDADDVAWERVLV